MKALLVYWFTGCLIIGLAFGKQMEQCPRDDIPMAEALMAVAAWPVFIFASFTSPRHIPKTPCKIT